MKTGDPAWITDLGGSITRDPQGHVIAVSLRGSWVGDTDLRRLNEYPDLTTLDLSLTHITDQGMLEIKNLSGVADLNLYFAEYVTDEGLAAIKDVPSVIYGKATFDPQTRRVAGARAVYLIVKDNKFLLWDGKKPGGA